MQETFPRAVVDELRKRRDVYRYRGKVYLNALIMSEAQKSNIVVDNIDDEVQQMVSVDESGNIVGMNDALNRLRNK
jgi:hypothetical protein